MGEYEVRLERAAVEGLADLSGADAKKVDKALGKLETSPELGKPLGNRLGIKRYERKLWMRDLVMGVAYPPVDP